MLVGHWRFLLAGAGGGNLIGNSLEAFVKSSSLKTQDSIVIFAESKDSVSGYWATAGGSAGGALSAAVFVNKLTSTTKAYISDDSVIHAAGRNAATVDYWLDNSDGSNSDHSANQSVSGLSVVANVDNDLEMISVAAAVSGVAGIGANVVTNIINTTSEASITDSNVNTDQARGKTVLVLAHQDTDISSGGGAAAGSVLSAAAAIDVNTLDNTTKAFISGDAATGQKSPIFAQNIEVTALAEEVVRTAVLGASAGLAFGGAGSSSTIHSLSRTDAFIRLASVKANNVKVNARSYHAADFVGGSLTAGTAGVGATVEVGIFEGLTKAYIAGSTVDATSDVDVTARSYEVIDVTAVSGGLSGVGIVGAVSAMNITSDTAAWIGSYTDGSSGTTHSNINAGDTVKVTSNNKIDLNQNRDGLVGAASITGVGAGASVEVVTILNNSTAYIDDNAVVNSVNGVAVKSGSDRNLSSDVVAFQGGGIGISGSVSVLNVGAGMRSNSEADQSTNALQSTLDTVLNGSVDNDTDYNYQAGVADIFRSSLASFVSLAFDLDVLGVGGTTAYIGANALVTATNGDIEVSANETVDIDANNIFAALGAGAGFGGGVVAVSLSSETKAYVAAGATINASDDVKISAEYSNNVDAQAYGGAAGAGVGIGAQVAVVDDTSKQLAYTGNALFDSAGTNIIAAGDIDINAKATRNVDAQAKGITAAAIAAGAAIGSVDVAGETKAYLGRHSQVDGSSAANNSPSSLDISAESVFDADVDVWTVAGGIGAGTGNDAKVNYSSKIHAYIGEGSNVDITGHLAIDAKVTPYVNAKITGVNAGVFNVGVSLVDIVIEPDLVAKIGDTGGSESKGVEVDAKSISVTAKNIIGSNGYTADTESTSASVGFLLGVDAAVNKITNKTSTYARIGDYASITTTHAVKVLAENDTKHRAKSGGGAGSLFAAVGVGHAEINTATDTQAHMGSTPNISAGSLDIQALSHNNNFVDLVTGSVGLSLSGAGVKAKTSDRSKAKAVLAGGSSATKNVTLTGSLGANDGRSGGFVLKSENIAEFDHKVLVFSGGMLAGTGADVDHFIELETLSNVGNMAIINATDMSITADAEVKKTIQSGKNLDGYAIAGIAGAGSDTTIGLDVDTQVTIDDDAKLTVSGNKSAPGAVNLHTLNKYIIDDESLFVAAGGLAGVGSYTDIVTNQNISKVTVGDADIKSIGEVHITARGNADIDSRVYTESHGVGTLSIGRSLVDIKPENTVIFKSGALVESDGDFRTSAGISASSDWFTQRDVYDVNAKLTNFSASLIPIDDLDAKITLEQNNSVTIEKDAVVNVGGIARIYAEDLGTGNVVAVSDSTNWASALNDLVSGTKLTGGTASSGGQGTVTIDGEVHTGLNRNVGLTLTRGANNVLNSSGELSYSTGIAQKVPALKKDLAFAKKMQQDYPDSETIQDFYSSEETRIENELRAQGLWDNLSSSAENKAVQTVTVDKVLAQAGYIDIIADALASSSGSGVLDAPGDANVAIINDSGAFLVIDGIEIPDTVGGVRFNSVEVNSNAEITAKNNITYQAGDKKTIEFFIDPTTEEWSLKIKSNTESVQEDVVTADFETITDNTTSNQPVITIINTAAIGRWIQPDLTIRGELLNYRGDINISNTDNNGKGSIYIEAAVSAKNLQVTAGGTLSVQGATRFQTGSEGYSIINPLTTPAPNGEFGSSSANDTKTNSQIASILAASSQDNLVIADRIVIEATDVNLNGILQSGQALKSLTLSQSKLDQFKQELYGRTGKVWMSEMGQANYDVNRDGLINSSDRMRKSLFDGFNVFYNTGGDGSIEVDDVAISGGYIDITGRIFNTGAGEIKVLGGYGDISITNNTNLKVIVNRVDNSSRGVGKLIIKDTAIGSVANPFVTIYTMDENGVSKNGGAASTNTTSPRYYQPKDGMRYQYEINETTGTYYYDRDSQSSWLGMDWIAPDPATVSWDRGPTTLSSTLGDSGLVFKEFDPISLAVLNFPAFNPVTLTLEPSRPQLAGVTKDTPYFYYQKDPVTDSDVVKEINRGVDTNWIGTKTYWTERERTVGQTITHVHNIKADNVVKISFLGDRTSGDINLTSTQINADISLAGSIANTTGSTNIDSKGSIEADSAISVGGLHIDLKAHKGIGKKTSAVGVEQITSDTATFRARSTTGEVHIKERTGTLRINSIESSASKQVTVTADSLVGFGSSASHIKGHSIELETLAGAIGSAAEPLRIDSSNVYNSQFNAKATTSIYVKEISGDLRVETLNSVAGEVVVNVASGSFIDANGNDVVNIAGREALLGAWQALELRDEDDGSVGSNAKWDEGKQALAAVKEAGYRSYWSYRGQFSSYDASQTVALDAAEEAFYRNQYADPDSAEADAAIASLVAKRSAEYHSLHTEWGALGDVFDPSYTYTLSMTEAARIEEGIKVWTEDELLSVIGAGMLVPVTSTNTVLEDDNVTANSDISLTTFGSMGSALAGMEIDTSSKPLQLTDDEKIALFSAERVDINYLASDFVTTTVNFTHSDSAGDTIVRRDGGSWLSAGFKAGDTIRVFESASSKSITRNVSQGGAVLTIASVSANQITLESNDSVISEISKQVRIASVIPDPMATLNYITDLSFTHNETSGDVISRSSGSWIADGFKEGMRFKLSASTNNDTAENGFYTIAGITANSLTLSLAAELVAGSDNNVMLSRGISIDKIYVDQRDDIDVSSQSGSITAIANSSGARAEASIFLGSKADLNLEEVTSTGTVRIKTQGSIINATGDQTTINVAGENVVLEAGQGSIGTQGAQILLDVEANTAITARASGDIYLIETSGDMEVGTLFSQQGGIQLTANQGAVVDALNHDFANVSAKTYFVVSALNGVGEVGDALEIDMQGSGDEFISVTTTTGDILLSELVGNMSIKRIQTGGGDITLTAQGSILDVADAGADSADSGSLNYVSSLPKADVVANNISLTATTGNIGLSGNDLDINTAANAAGSLTTSSGLSTYLIETEGDLSIDTIDSGLVGGAVNTSEAFILSFGRILNSRSTGVNVNSGKVQLFAVGDIGTASKSLETQIGFLEGKSETGNVWLTNTGHLVVGGLANEKGLTAIGNIDLKANSPITIDKDLRSTDGDISISSSDEADPLADFLLIENDIEVIAEAGSIFLNSGDNLTISSGAKVFAAQSLSISLEADNADAEGVDMLVDGTIVATDISVNAAGDNDNLTFNTAIANDVINDTLGNKLSDIVVNSFIVNTGAGNDSVVLNENISAVTVAIDLGDGNNQLNLAASKALTTSSFNLTSWLG